MLRANAFVCGLVVVCVAARVQAQAPAPPSVHTWSARSASGMVLMGTFTVVPDSASGTVTGAWTLERAPGRVVARGGWSASKSPAGWTGAWRSIVAGSSREYSGTWSASTPLRGRESLPQLFLRTRVEHVTSGGWRSAGTSGSWSIRLGA